jgi:hypothetical protein
VLAPDPQSRAIDVVAEGIRVLQTRDGVQLSDDQIRERARNIVMALSLPIESAVADATGAVAALLADPLDPDVRAGALAWLRARARAARGA